VRAGRLLLWVLGGAAIGYLAPNWPTALVASTLACGAYVLYVWLRLPSRCRALTANQLDPAAGPPPGFPLVELPAAERWAAALSSRDWATVRRMLADDFVLTVGGRPFGAKEFMRGNRMMATAYPSLAVAVDEAHADPDDPDVTWVRFTEHGRPRLGAPLEATWWERWTLDREHERIRASELAGVTRLA
jgi:hypothetical protein